MDLKSPRFPARVPGRAKQVGEASSRWDWVEGVVWTERMLEALDKGVKGGKWFSLIDKVYAKRTLRAAFDRVRRNGGSAGVDHVTIRQFGSRLEEELEALSASLAEGQYRPQAIRRRWIPKPGGREKRPLGIPTVRDRVVQTALRMVLEPIFERDFAEPSYGFRPGRGCLDALARVEDLLGSGYTWVVDADLQSFFDTIDPERLLARVQEKVSDGRVIALVAAFLQQKVMEGLEGWTPTRGTPQGSPLSPLLANIFLDSLDHLLVDEGLELVRYADDFVILCRTQADTRRALRLVEEWTSREGLMLHPQKTGIVDATQRGGFDFLGYHFERGYKWPRRKSIQALKDRLRVPTRRTSGHCLARITGEVNRTLEGWYGYFQYSHSTTFDPLDKWIRMRLRSILRKRQGRRGRGRGRDHNRWPNAFFAEQGLFSLVAASASARQSSPR
jgi:RNA-directed DNA polymerase